MMDTIKFNSGNTKVVAHRGLSGLETENTCAAFVTAGNRSYFGIETDVHRTADGKFVVIHDDNTKRVGVDHLVVEETTFDTLRNLQLVDKDGQRGRSDLRIPSLSEYISICKRYEKVAVPELKQPMQPEEIAVVVEEFRAQAYLENTVFISFHWENLAEIRRLVPGQAV